MKITSFSPTCSPMSGHVTVTALAIGTLLGIASSTYVAEKKYDHFNKANSISNDMYGRRYGPLFRNDHDVRRYLSLFGADAMLWRCKNAIQPYWNWKPLPVVELYCEAIGSMRAVHWYHKRKPLHLGHRHKLSIYPHYHAGHYFSNWIDFRLRIYNATQKDSGVYTFEMTGKQGSKNSQNIYVDISEKRRKRKERLWRESYKRHRKDHKE